MEYFSEQFNAIGVLNQVTVLDESALDAAVALARREIEALDDVCSRFREDSELTYLNRERSAQVSALLLAALQAALEAAESTGGLVDPTIGRSIRAVGYDRDFGVILRSRGPGGFELIPAAGWRTVRVDRRTATVTLAAGSELDLGATAKAFAADRIAHAINSLTGSSVMVSLGGDIAVAGSGPEGGWPILVTDDSRALDASGQVVGVHAGGLATSSTTVRRWHAAGTAMHHILDPRTGAPAAVRWRTVSVAATTCLEANVAATAAIVLGEQAPGWLAARQLSARLVAPDGFVETTGAWPTVPARPEKGMPSASATEVLHR